MLVVTSKMLQDGINKILEFAKATVPDIKEWEIEIESISGAKRLILTLYDGFSYEVYICDSSCDGNHDLIHKMEAKCQK